MSTTAPRRVYDSFRSEVWSGDARAVMESLTSQSVDALITDPPYGLSSPPNIDEVLEHWEKGDDYHHGGSGFMQRSWDAFVPGPSVWREALRVVKPGAPAVVFAGSRTLDLMMASMRLAGWEILGTRHWRYGSGLPKALNIGKAVAREASRSSTATPDPELAQRWDGWKSTLKGAHEPMVVARAPGAGGTVQLSDPYTPKAPSKERLCVYVPECTCYGDPHRLGADPDLAQLRPQVCAQCRTPYSEYRHPTVKPLMLCRELVLVCPPGGLLLDPFAGTGSTGVAAAMEGRHSLLVDADPVHAAMCAHRLSAVITTRNGVSAAA